MTFPTTFRYLLFSALISLGFSFSALAGDDWKPIDPAHLAMKTSIVEKDADAEVIFWEVYVDDSGEDLIFNHYIRTKIFTDRGVNSQGQVEIEYLDYNRVKDIAARTIKPDGTIVELKKDSIFDRVKVKISGLKLKVKSFAMPSVEPGSIIEYRYREVHPQSMIRSLKLDFQKSIPVQQVTYYLKPATSAYSGSMQTFTFNVQARDFTKEKNGFYSMTMNNVPAFHEEPNMPPEDKVRSWMLVYYTRDTGKVEPAKYWGTMGKFIYEDFKDKVKVNDDVRKAANEAIAGATSSDDKLIKLLEFCRVKIKNIHSDTSGLSNEEKKKLKDNHNPGDTLKRGYGASNDIDCLFASMATAIGFEARLALIPDRGQFFFDPSYTTTYFLKGGEIAVKVDGQWKFYDPSSKYIVPGMLPWGYEGVQALITDPKEPSWAQTPLSAPEKSMEKSVGKFTLSEEGTLEGDAQIQFTGHFAKTMKDYNDDDSQEKREATLKEKIKAHFGAAEITNIRIENVTDPLKPFTYLFHIKVPNYATRTGKRLFLQPAFFQFGEAARFTTTDRKYPVYFKYPYVEDSTVQIDLPAGFALDNAEAPQSFNAQDIIKYDTSLGVTKDQKTVVYKRNFRFNGMLFPVSAYPVLKQIFDQVHAQDNHQVTLKLGAATTATK